LNSNGLYILPPSTNFKYRLVQKLSTPPLGGVLNFLLWVAVENQFKYTPFGVYLNLVLEGTPPFGGVLKILLWVAVVNQFRYTPLGVYLNLILEGK
jgi:hypothetical protein